MCFCTATRALICPFRRLLHPSLIDGPMSNVISLLEVTSQRTSSLSPSDFLDVAIIARRDAANRDLGRLIPPRLSVRALRISSLCAIAGAVYPSLASVAAQSKVLPVEARTTATRLWNFHRRLTHKNERWRTLRTARVTWAPPDLRLPDGCRTPGFCPNAGCNLAISSRSQSCTLIQVAHGGYSWNWVMVHFLGSGMVGLGTSSLCECFRPSMPLHKYSTFYRTQILVVLKSTFVLISVVHCSQFLGCDPSLCSSRAGFDSPAAYSDGGIPFAPRGDMFFGARHTSQEGINLGCFDGQKPVVKLSISTQRNTYLPAKSN
ncbi:hypothetical protein C8R44DRAFT_118098 [Mycena epipterygia]|nr:hypothetical protein C8R44DRAFT_118098 [Mycena epipterygia]